MSTMNKNKSMTSEYDDSGFLQVDLPKSDLILILGISSILFCFAFGIVGIVIGLISRKLSLKSLELYKQAPELYTSFSYKNVKAGRICALIGIILSSVFFVLVVAYYLFKTVVFSVF